MAPKRAKGAAASPKGGINKYFGKQGEDEKKHKHRDIPAAVKTKAKPKAVKADAKPRASRKRACVGDDDDDDDAPFEDLKQPTPSPKKKPRRKTLKALASSPTSEPFKLSDVTKQNAGKLEEEEREPVVGAEAHSPSPTGGNDLCLQNIPRPSHEAFANVTVPVSTAGDSPPKVPVEHVEPSFHSQQKGLNLTTAGNAVEKPFVAEPAEPEAALLKNGESESVKENADSESVRESADSEVANSGTTLQPEVPSSPPVVHDDAEKAEVDAAAATAETEPTSFSPLPSLPDNQNGDEHCVRPLASSERKRILTQMFRWPFLVMDIVYNLCTHPLKDMIPTSKDASVKVASSVRKYVQSLTETTAPAVQIQPEPPVLEIESDSQSSDSEPSRLKSQSCGSDKDSKRTTFFRNLVEHMETVTMSSCFSGVDTPATSYMGLAWGACGQAGYDSDRMPQPRNLFAVEKFSKSIEQLLVHPHPAEHIFDDVECFWAPTMAAELQHANLTEDYVEQTVIPAVFSHKASVDSAYCLKHQRRCKAGCFDTLVRQSL